MENRKIKIEKKNKMNVKPKNLNVMKRFLFTLMAFVALVLIANTTFAQAETSPVVGASYNYTVSGLTNGNTYQFDLSTSTTTVAGTVSGTINPGTATGTVGSTVSGTTNTATITWNSTDTNYLWITVTNTSTNCFNMRYIEITPTANDFDVEVIALGTSTQTAYPSWETATSNGDDCHVYVGANFNISGGSDGSSYVYFRVDIVAMNDIANTWDLDGFDMTGAGIAQITATEYSTDGSSWSGTLPTGLANTDQVLVRLTVTNLPGGVALTGTSDASENEGDDSAGVPDSVSGNDAANFSILAYPDMSGAAFN